MASIAKRKTRSAYQRIPGTAYDGSAARRLERAEVLEPRPRVRPRERAVSRPRVQVRETGRVSIFAVVGFAAVAVFAVLLLMSYVQLAQISDDVVSLKREMTTLQSDEAQLRAEYALAYDLSEIEQKLTADGSMIRPDDSQICYVDLSEPDAIEFLTEDAPVKGVEGVIRSIQEIVGEVVEYFR